MPGPPIDRPWEAEFIDLWQQGLELIEMAQRLGIPRGTVSSRAMTLVREGKIQSRGRGGAYPRQRALARQAGAPDPPAPARAPAPMDAALPTRETPAITMVAVPELRELINRFSGLEARVAALEVDTRVGTRIDTRVDTRIDTRDLPAPHPRVHIKQWTVRLSQALIDAVKAQATTAGKEPSHLVEELLWKALNDQSPSTP